MVTERTWLPAAVYSRNASCGYGWTLARRLLDRTSRSSSPSRTNCHFDGWLRLRHRNNAEKRDLFMGTALRSGKFSLAAQAAWVGQPREARRIREHELVVRRSQRGFWWGLLRL